jgi:nucleoside-diphosphate-sugar epimerase
MNLLLTGASGFLGSQLYAACSSCFHVITLGTKAVNAIQCDLSNEQPNIQNIQAVIHAAGKAHTYPTTEEEKQAFFSVNVLGTENLLKSLEDVNIEKFIFVSSVAVYGLEMGYLIDERNPLLGLSPYALSKMKAEQAVISWCKVKQIPYLIVRLPLIAGPNPPGNLGKMIWAIRQGRYVRFAHGESRKSMVLASDVASLFIKWLKDKKSVSGIYNLTDGYHPSFFELEEAFKNAFGKSWIPSLPHYITALLAKIGDRFPFFPLNSELMNKITNTLTFSDEKAVIELGWKPHRVLEAIPSLISKG